MSLRGTCSAVSHHMCAPAKRLAHNRPGLLRVCARLTADDDAPIRNAKKNAYIPNPRYPLKISFKKFIFIYVLVIQPLLLHLYETRGGLWIAFVIAFGLCAIPCLC